jgi:predicted XRE-type DNA-binding protein
MPQPVLTDMNPRLRAAAVEVADTREKHRAAMELRNQLVVAAVDHGMSQRAVAAAAGVTVTRVSALLLAAD